MVDRGSGSVGQFRSGGKETWMFCSARPVLDRAECSLGAGNLIGEPYPVISLLPDSPLRRRLIDCQKCQQPAHCCPREHGFRFLPHEGADERAEGRHRRDMIPVSRGAELPDETASGIGSFEIRLVMYTEVPYMQADWRPLRPAKIRPLPDRQTHARHETCRAGMFNLVLLHAEYRSCRLCGQQLRNFVPEPDAANHGHSASSMRCSMMSMSAGCCRSAMPRPSLMESARRLTR